MSRRSILTALGALLLGIARAEAAPFSHSPDDGPQPGNPSSPGLGQPTSQSRSPDADKPSAFWERETLTGDWGGWRKRLEERGITFNPVYQGEIFGNTGGRRSGFVADGVINAELDFDLERLTGFWKDATIHANMLYLYGPSLSERYVGDISQTSNITGYNSVRLQEVWLEQDVWEKRFSMRVGLLAADTEFMIADAAGLFLSGTFGAFNLVAANFLDAPVYPVANPGVRLSFSPTPALYVKAAVFGTDASSDPAVNNQHGTHFHINEADGALFIGEAGYLRNQAKDDHGLAGSYKVGAFVHRGEYPTFSSQARDALGTGGLSGKGTNYAVYAIANQDLYRDGSQTISAFARAGWAPSRLSLVDRYVDGGFNFTGFLPGRPDDIAGVAVAYSHLSGDYSESQEAQGNAPSSYETVLEATYKVVLTPWWSVQPDLQYIFNPSGVEGSRDAWVFGLRTTVSF